MIVPYIDTKRLILKRYIMYKCNKIYTKSGEVSKDLFQMVQKLEKHVDQRFV